MLTLYVLTHVLFLAAIPFPKAAFIANEGTSGLLSISLPPPRTSRVSTQFPQRTVSGPSYHLARLRHRSLHTGICSRHPRTFARVLAAPDRPSEERPDRGCVGLLDHPHWSEDLEAGNCMRYCSKYQNSGNEGRHGGWGRCFRERERERERRRREVGTL